MIRYRSARHTEDDFWRAVVTRRDDSAVVFVMESRRTKVDQSNVRTLDATNHPLLYRRNTYAQYKKRLN